MDNQENNQTNLNQGGISSAPPAADQGVSQMPDNHPMGVPVDPPVQAQGTQTVSQPPPADPPTDSPLPPPPLSNQVEQGTSDPKHKSDNKLFIFIIGAVLVLIIFIVIIFITASGNNQQNNQPVPTPQAQAVTPTPEEQGMASEQPITSQQDVNNALNELDQINPDTVGSDLDKNDQDAATF